MLDDLVPSDPIVRALVDELLVKCPNTGCKHVCQRQLLASHVQRSCLYTPVPCPFANCKQLVSPSDIKTHECRTNSSTCPGCDEQVPLSEVELHSQNCRVECSHCSAKLSAAELDEHIEHCPKFQAPCSQERNGCPWQGPRDSLASHLSVCSYEAIKGFFPIFDAKTIALKDENVILKHKAEVLEGRLQVMEKELLAAKLALGPWYKRDGMPPQLLSSAFDTSEEGSSGSYFPVDRTQARTGIGSSYLTGWDVSQHPIAPLDLGTSLEGSLLGLRQSLVSVAASVESLGRRNDIALTNETLRLNEEIMSLRANIHGLRMQVHAMMTNRNAQVLNEVYGNVQTTKL